MWEHHRVERPAPPKPPRDLRGEGRELWIQDHRPGPKRVPNGVLELRLRLDGLRPSWKDYPRRPLEQQLDEVMAGIAALPSRAKEAQAEAERRREIDERANRARRHQEYRVEQARLEAERRAKEQRRLDEEVIASLERWRLARELRAFAADARSRAGEGRITIEPGSQVDRLVSRALEFADRIDPLGLAAHARGE